MSEYSDMELGEEEKVSSKPTEQGVGRGARQKPRERNERKHKERRCGKRSLRLKRLGLVQSWKAVSHHFLPRVPPRSGSPGVEKGSEAGKWSLFWQQKPSSRLPGRLG